MPGEEGTLADFEAAFPTVDTWLMGLDTSRAQKVSKHLRNAVSVGDDALKLYARW